MNDQESEAMRAYDRAVLALHEHILICSECSMWSAEDYCPSGRALDRAQSAAWGAYRDFVRGWR